MTSRLGRGGSYISFESGRVIKRFPDGSVEPFFMQLFPDVFVPVTVIDIARKQFTMPEYEQADLSDMLHAAGLLQQIWGFYAKVPADWCEKLTAHLFLQNYKHLLNIDNSRIHHLTSNLPYVSRHCKIHGDPTLANLLVGPDGPRWIDPLFRDYIPGDPHVDLGKMYQSCMGYEDVLLGRKPKIDQQLMKKLADTLGLNSKIGLVWCNIHFIRLLPYQKPEDRPKFVELLHAIPEVLA